MYICPIVDLYYNKMESKTPSREKEIYKVTVVGSVVNFLLLVFKFFAGIAGHSAAMPVSYTHLDVYKRQLPYRIPDSGRRSTA